MNAWVFFRISGGLFNPAVSASHIHDRDGQAKDSQCLDPQLNHVLGDGRHGPHWCHLSCARSSPFHHPNRSGHSRGIHRTSVIPRPTGSFNNTWGRHNNRPGRDNRDDFDRATCLYDFHAGSGKAPGELHRASGDRIESFHRRARW